jgi:hypothetical protein
MKRTPATTEESNGTYVGGIEKGIKVPEQRMRNGIKYPFSEMKVGDSFAINNPKKKENVLRNTIYGSIALYHKKFPNKHFIVRKVADHEYRVWRDK